MEQTTQVRISALMTAPRYEPVYARNYIELALKSCGIPLTVSGGVYYGQCMQIMLQNLIAQNVQYALTVDFDSMFTKRHVERLLSIIVSDDKIDAITAVQPKRGCGDLLAARTSGEEDIPWDGRPIQVDTAHFGLTVIDLEKLKDIPRPWFVSEPDKNGDWANEKIDDDVYFWKKWKANGNTCFIDPGTRLGHLEELVSVFDDQMQLQHLYPKVWADTNASTVD